MMRSRLFRREFDPFVAGAEQVDQSAAVGTPGIGRHDRQRPRAYRADQRLRLTGAGRRHRAGERANSVTYEALNASPKSPRRICFWPGSLP